MALVTIPDQQRTLRDRAVIAEFLAPFGIVHECWPLEERVDPGADSDDILRAYQPEIETLKARGGYVVADVISITPETPNLDLLLEKFRKEHTHSEDEVRFILKGRGLFHVRPEAGPVFAIEVEAGDLINVPRDTRHWFHLCGDRTIRAIRLFQETSGWTPHYVPDETHVHYRPLCWGPNVVMAERSARPMSSVVHV